jgi:thiol-disulfide isomerase/thioredoxin
MYRSLPAAAAVLTLTAAVFAAPRAQQGEAFRTAHRETGTIATFNYYRVMQEPMTTRKPAHITKEPMYKNPPLYTVLHFGSDRKRPVVFALDEDEAGAAFYVDANADGDLTDDPAPTLWRRQEAPPERRSVMKVWLTYWYDGMATASYGDRTEKLGIKFYIYSKADRERSKIDPVLLYYRDYYRTGSIELGGKAFQAALVDDDSDGRYDSPPREALRFPGDTLLIDADASGKFERSAESYPLNQPFNIGGTTYEVAKVSPDGSRLEVRKSDKSVPERKPTATLKVGDTPPSLAQSGGAADRDVVTLEKYRGKVVLVDFWATWCGPCIAEMPAVKKLYEANRAKGFEIISVSLDQPNDGPKMAKYVRETGIAWPQVHDATREVSRRYHVSSIPATFLIGRDGRLVAVGLRGEELEKAVAEALK